MMMMMTARNTSGGGTAGKKKPRKPYTVSRPREKWTAEEHDRFLHALLRFGRDWKTIEQVVGTKTATQIRSHAQKYFLKAHKLGLAAALPPPHSHRRTTAAVALPQPAVRSCCFVLDDAAAASLTVSPPVAGAWQSGVDWAAAASCAAASPAGASRWPNHPNHDESFMATPNSGGGGSHCLLQEDATARQLPLSPDDLRFAEVYRFVGDVFGSGAPRPVEAQLHRLHGVDPVVAETILLVLCNLQDNLSG